MNHDCSKCEANLECRITLACREEHDNLETITWHEFPKEYPPEEDGKYTTDLVDYDEANDYLCTIMPCNIPRVVCLRYLKSHTWVDGDEAIKIDGEFCDEDYSSYHVIAWAELPKPYKR